MNDFHGVLAKPFCENSRLFCCIAKQSLLDSKLITYIQKMGYDVIIVDKKLEKNFKECENVERD
jgi:hypothetical protein